MEYVYHLLPSKMYGKILFPLSEIEDKYPQLYKQQVKNYKDREDLLNKQIKPLKCSWEDVLFLSTLNPEIIFAALEMLGLLDNQTAKILKFPIAALKNDFCYYQENDEEETFKKTKQSNYEEEKELPIETIEYFIDCVKKKENPLIFSGIKHILYKGSLDISKAKIIKYKKLI